MNRSLTKFLSLRLILGLLVVQCRDVLFYQFFGLIMSTVFAVIILGESRPMDKEIANKMEFLNEAMIMFVMYNMLCFTDWQNDPVIRET